MIIGIAIFEVYLELVRVIGVQLEWELSSPSDAARMPSKPTASRPQLPSETIYTDDADVISTDHDYLSKVNEIAPTALDDWFLCLNVDKTELTIISREVDRVAEEWRTTKKLVPLLGYVGDLLRRKMLVVTASRSTWYLRHRRQRASEQLRLRLYDAWVRPVLI